MECLSSMRTRRFNRDKFVSNRTERVSATRADLAPRSEVRQKRIFRSSNAATNARKAPLLSGERGHSAWLLGDCTRPTQRWVQWLGMVCPEGPMTPPERGPKDILALLGIERFHGGTTHASSDLCASLDEQRAGPDCADARVARGLPASGMTDRGRACGRRNLRREGT